MKLFRRIAALALAVAVVAMFGISASAADFTRNVSGDFGVGVGAMFKGDLELRKATAEVEFFGDETEDDDIDLEWQRVQIACSYLDSFGDMQGEVADVTDRTRKCFSVEVTIDSPLTIASATYRYDAYYVANGVVECHISDGPVTLTN